MIRICEQVKYLNREQGGKPVYDMVLYADTAAELADVTEVGGMVIAEGSVAYTADGKRIVLDSEGTWHDLADGTAIEGE